MPNCDKCGQKLKEPYVEPDLAKLQNEMKDGYIRFVFTSPFWWDNLKSKRQEYS